MDLAFNLSSQTWRLIWSEPTADLSQPGSVETKVLVEYLRSYSRRLSFLMALETQGAVQPAQVRQEMKLLWNQLRQTLIDLGICSQNCLSSL